MFKKLQSLFGSKTNDGCCNIEIQEVGLEENICCDVKIEQPSADEDSCCSSSQSQASKTDCCDDKIEPFFQETEKKQGCCTVKIEEISAK